MKLSMAALRRICLGLRSHVRLASAFTHKHLFMTHFKVISCSNSLSSQRRMNAEVNKSQQMQSEIHDCQMKNSPIIWIDLEMTGLDVEKEKIIEIACLVTDGDLKIIAEGPNIIIHQSDEILNSMGEWCTLQHGQSGLTDAVRKSQINTAEAERCVLEFLKKHTEKGLCPLAGNSVYMDKLFLIKYMPSLAEHFHHRIIDVSTIKELCRRWYPHIYATVPSKKSTHRALEDILESVEELKYYRSSIFKS